MRIKFIGAARTTTGSMHMLELNGSRLLLDCGLYQGRRKEAFERNRNLPFDPDSVDACILSHAHIDHSGNLPSLVKSGFRGRIITTPATRDLCEIMLADSAYLQVQDVAYVNKKRARQGKNPFEPLYTPDDVGPTLAAFRTVPYEESVEVAPGAVLTFHDAGHVLGSAFVQLDVRENGSAARLFFTGDMGRKGMPILKDPVMLSDVDILITESTYGNRDHPAHEDVKSRLAELCTHIVDNEARLLIPAFSVGRTQQIVYFLNELSGEGRIAEIPVYVDSPLSTKATAIYEKHTECYDAEAIALLRNGDRPFSFPRLSYVTDTKDSMKLNDARGPVIIISASGMCEGGRILHHLKRTVEDSRNVILIVGYQAEHTLGRRLVEKETRVRIFGDEFNVRARVETINALSAHADRNEMRAYYEEMDGAVDKAFVVHGEAEACTEMARSLEDLGARQVHIPERGEEYDL